MYKNSFDNVNRRKNVCVCVWDESEGCDFQCTIKVLKDDLGVRIPHIYKASFLLTA